MTLSSSPEDFSQILRERSLLAVTILFSKKNAVHDRHFRAINFEEKVVDVQFQSRGQFLS